VAPEGLGSGEVLEGPPLGPRLDQVEEARERFSLAPGGRPAQQGGAVPAGDVAKEKLGVAIGLLDAGGGQEPRRLPEGGDEVQAAPLSFAAWL
jgi:hypothetical protein